MDVRTGKFVISLDFELFWGVRDLVTFEQYGQNLRGVHTAIPRLLNTFKKHEIKATFATVGLLFFSTKQEINDNLPETKPNYSNPVLSPYNNEMQFVGESYKTDFYHFAPQLIELIRSTPGQEIATHTFCHYYCLEAGQTLDEFREDLKAAIKIAATKNIQLKSIVFPRNQFNNEYLEVCKELGIICVRGNESSWLYEARTSGAESSIRRGLRLVDAYINISGQHGYTDEFMTAGYPYNIPSSRFLRPYEKRMEWFDGLRLRRIKKSMTHAAVNNLTFHLWWHPHNFGRNQNQNFAFLEKILAHYNYLHQTHNFTNYTMAELASYLHQKYGA